MGHPRAPKGPRRQHLRALKGAPEGHQPPRATKGHPKATNGAPHGHPSSTPGAAHIRGVDAEGVRREPLGADAALQFDLSQLPPVLLIHRPRLCVHGLGAVRGGLLRAAQRRLSPSEPSSPPPAMCPTYHRILPARGFGLHSSSGGVPRRGLPPARPQTTPQRGSPPSRGLPAPRSAPALPALGVGGARFGRGGRFSGRGLRGRLCALPRGSRHCRCRRCRRRHCCWRSRESWPRAPLSRDSRLQRAMLAVGPTSRWQQRPLPAAGGKSGR